MWLLVWFLGWPVMMLGAWLLYILITKVAIPYNKFVFENLNEHGAVALSNWDEAVKFQKYEVKKELLEMIFGLPGVILLVGGALMILAPTCRFLFW